MKIGLFVKESRLRTELANHAVRELSYSYRSRLRPRVVAIEAKSRITARPQKNAVVVACDPTNALPLINAGSTSTAVKIPSSAHTPPARPKIKASSVMVESPPFLLGESS